MKQNKFLHFQRILYFLCVIAFVVLGFYFYSQWNAHAVPNSAEDPTLIPRILSYFQQPGKIVGLWQTLLGSVGLAGSSFLIRYMVIFVVALPAIHLIQWTLIKKGAIKERCLYSNPAFVIFVLAWILLGMTINGIAQAEGLYYDPRHNIPGDFDSVTHIIAVGAIYGFLLLFDWSEIFGWWEGKFRDLLLDQGFSISLLWMIMWFFEYTENLDPAKYSGGINDTLSDVFIGFVAMALIGFVYLLTYLLDERTQT